MVYCEGCPLVTSMQAADSCERVTADRKVKFVFRRALINQGTLNALMHMHMYMCMLSLLLGLAFQGVVS